MVEICKHESSSGILQKEIAAVQEIPLKYLDQIVKRNKTSININ